jgi:hypothetical protein
MDEKYRLTFRGEVLDGQHRAVVKRRLSELLKLEDAQIDKLFAGNPVVLKRDVDRSTAARYQGLFKKAGARLRVTAQTATPPAGTPEKAAAATEPAASPDYSLAAVGSELSDVRDESPPPAPEAEFELAEVGVDLLTERVETPVVDLGPLDFEVAEVGADIGPQAQPSDACAPDVSHLKLVDP